MLERRLWSEMHYRHCTACVTAWFVPLLATTTFAQPATNDRPVKSTAVSYEQIKNADLQPDNWLTYSGQYHGQRHSRLDRIDTGNVGQLRVKWVRQYPTFDPIETSPLVVDGIIYATLPEDKVVALDAKTGLRIWEYRAVIEQQLALCCGKVNRGVAILDNTLFLGTLDARLLALDARTGRELWDMPLASAKDGYSITSAPLVVKDLVITGIAGGEYGIRGFVEAREARTGERRWKRYAIPGRGEPGNETWEGDSWEHGGGATWMTGAYDPELDLVYWGVGNPGPDLNGEKRAGDNLYSCCVLALKADTGEIVWHFQFTPHDLHDWDACQVPILVDRQWEGKPRKLMLWANRNGFFYVLDRRTGEFLLGKNFALQSWAKGLDDKGRPLVIPGTAPSDNGVWVAPDMGGAANWWSPSYSPKTGFYYVTAFDGGTKYYIGREEFKKGQFFLGGATEMDNDFRENIDPKFSSAVRAIDPATGNKVWEYRLKPKSTSGLLTTAGGLLFGGARDGNFFALDARDGKELWRLDLGGRVHAAPVTYLVDGQQYITIAAGNALYTLGH